jgi:hypothetical protein
VPHLSQVIIAAKPFAPGAGTSAGVKNYLIAKRLTAPKALHPAAKD